MADKKRSERNRTIVLWILGATAIGLIAIGIIAPRDPNSTNDLQNWAAIFVEAGIAVFITGVIYYVSNKQQSRISELTKQIKTMIEEQHEFFKEQKNRKRKQENAVDVSLLNVFREIETNIEIIYGNVSLYENSSDAIHKEFYKRKIITECQKIRQHAEENFDNPSIISPDFFDVATIQKFKTLSMLCKNQPDFNTEENKMSVVFCDTIKNMIKPMVDDFYQRTARRAEMIPRVKLESKTDTLSISVSSDRTVYPLDSNIHVQANLSSIVHGEKTLFEIFNSDRKRIASKEIELEKYGQLRTNEPGMVETSFRMQGSDWKIDEEYIIRVTHASSYSEDSFFVDQRMPALQSDKSVYMINSDIIITIIDPDADKDSKIAESAGDREDSKLIIETPYGKIDGYRLRETGNSTGIFQGIIGVLGIRKDGSVIERNVDGKIINKIQGTNLDDGFIGGPPGEEIIASYKNNTGTVYLSMFVSNFGAAIEMDKKVYSPGDKVYLTIIAPDFNFDSYSIDEIGQKPESSITIRTGRDEIMNYRLIETNLDTGIFTGELHLMESENHQSGSHGTGPNDGRIACDKDDFIEVTFSLFGFENVVGRALIKPSNEKPTDTN